MKVRCKNIYNEITKEYVQENSWLTVGKEYIVYEIRVYSSDISYRLVGDNENKMPALYNASQFEIVKGGISKRWVVSQPKEGVFVFGPIAWQVLGFWEDCYDLEPKALEIYRREAGFMLDEVMSDEE